MSIIANVVERVVEDNFEQGEIGKTEYYVVADGVAFKTPKEAIEWFRSEFGDDTVSIVLDDLNGTLMATKPPMAPDNSGALRVASEEEIEAWKRDEIKLYAVDYELSLSRCETIPLKITESDDAVPYTD